MKNKLLASVFALFMMVALSGCGVLIGQVMMAGSGLDKFEVVEGGKIPYGSPVLVVAPFKKTKDGFYISKGDDASFLVDALNENGALKAYFKFTDDMNNLDKSLAAFTQMSPDDLKAMLKVDVAPKYVVIGTILKRDVNVAPLKGLVTELTYRLDFYEAGKGKALSVNVAVKGLHEDVHGMIAKAIGDYLK